MELAADCVAPLDALAEAEELAVVPAEQPAQHKISASAATAQTHVATARAKETFLRMRHTPIVMIAVQFMMCLLA